MAENKEDDSVYHSNILESVVLGNKVVVFTRRPGTIKDVISVNYKRPGFQKTRTCNLITGR